MTTEQEINADIKTRKENYGLDTNLISDGYHTFAELYEHRITLFIALALSISVSETHNHSKEVWRMNVEDGWFLMGIGVDEGKQITYHLPESKWEQTDFCWLMKKEDFKFDGHTSEQVLKRIQAL